MTANNSALRNMIGRERNVPSSMTALRPLWDRMAEDVAQDFRQMLGCTVDHHPVEFKLTNSVAFARAHPEPGILLSVESGGAKGHYLRLSNESLLNLTTRLLRTSTVFERESLKVESLDSLLLRRSMATIVNRIEDTFEILIDLSPTPELHEWPFSAPGESTDFFCVTLSFSLADDYEFSVDLTIPPDTDNLHLTPPEIPPIDSAFIDSLLSGSTDVAAIVDEWVIDGSDLGQIKLGAELPLVEASLENLKLVAVNGRQTCTLGRAEHGRSGRFQALRIKEVDQAVRRA